MADVLTARGILAQEITLRASDRAGPPEGVITAPPTKAATLTALTNVSNRARVCDTVIFYFSGHGAQARNQSSDEGGGSDEIFLPAATSGWTRAVGTVENVLTQHELQA